jgi:hypothetical protein
VGTSSRSGWYSHSHTFCFLRLWSQTVFQVAPGAREAIGQTARRSSGRQGEKDSLVPVAPSLIPGLGENAATVFGRGGRRPRGPWMARGRRVIQL